MKPVALWIVGGTAERRALMRAKSKAGEQECSPYTGKVKSGAQELFACTGKVKSGEQECSPYTGRVKRGAQELFALHGQGEER